LIEIEKTTLIKKLPNVLQVRLSLVRLSRRRCAEVNLSSLQKGVDMADEYPAKAMLKSR